MKALTIMLSCQACWGTPVISALRKLRPEDGEFKGTLGYVGRPCLKTQKQKQKHPSTKQKVYKNVKNVLILII
jgi:hypothetical protein